MDIIAGLWLISLIWVAPFAVVGLICDLPSKRGWLSSLHAMALVYTFSSFVTGIVCFLGLLSFVTAKAFFGF